MWTYLHLLCYPALGILYQNVAMPYPCRLPAEYNQIPDFAREKLQSIWKNYKSGTSCVAEQIATDVLLAIVDIFSTKYHHEEGYSTTARSSIMKQKFASDDVQQYLIPRYSTSYQKLLSNMISSRLHQKRSEPQKQYYTEDSIYIDDDTINPTATAETSSEIHNNRYGYNSASNRISTILADKAVYDEVPILETSELPEFLKDASKDVINNFTKVWTDPNIPSEGLRKEMIHLLAVSLLTTKQLTAYNEYMSERRRCQRQLLLHVRRMSDEAQKALKILVYAEPNEQFALVNNFPRSVRRELQNFARQKTGKCA
ncbi:Protein PNG1 [Dirofilaria immitis]